MRWTVGHMTQAVPRQRGDRLIRCGEGPACGTAFCPSGPDQGVKLGRIGVRRSCAEPMMAAGLGHIISISQSC